jgi:hypothetical protein
VGRPTRRCSSARASPSATCGVPRSTTPNPGVLRAALQRDRPEFLINAAGYTGKPNVDACELHKAECLLGNAVLPGIVAQACEEAGVPWGHVSSGCIYTGDGPRQGVHRGGRAELHLPLRPLLLLQRDEGPRRGGAGRAPQPLRLAPADPLRRRRQPPQLPDQADALRRAPRGDELHLPAGRVRRGHPRLLDEARALRDLQRHEPRARDDPRGRRPHPPLRRLQRRSSSSFPTRRSSCGRREDPRSNCVLDSSKLGRRASG